MGECCDRQIGSLAGDDESTKNGRFGRFGRFFGSQRRFVAVFIFILTQLLAKMLSSELINWILLLSSPAFLLLRSLCLLFCLPSSPSFGLPPTSHLLPPTSYLLPPTSYFLPPTSYLLPPTCYLLPPTSYLLLPTSYLLPLTSYLLPATCYLLPATSYLLPSTSYFLPPPSYLLPRPRASTRRRAA